MDSEQDTISPVDAVRCFYLARVLEQKGEVAAAHRWDEQGRRWIQKQTPMAEDEAQAE
jgi:hypothetical protein